MIASSRGMRLFWLLGFVLLVGTGLGAGWVLNQPASGTGPSSGAVEPSSFGVVGLGFVDAEDGLGYLHPLQSGRVDYVNVKEGDFVNKGALLLSLDHSAQKLKLQEAMVALAVAEKELANAETTLVKDREHEIAIQKHKIKAARFELEAVQKERDTRKRFHDDPKNNLVSDDELALYEKKVQIAEESVKGQEAVLAKIEDTKPQNLIDLAREKVNQMKILRDRAHLAFVECDLYAPADGTVLRLFATPGDTLSAQSKQFAVQFCPNTPRVIRVEILQEFASAIKKGQIAYIEDDSRHGTQWKGKVERVSEILAPRRSIIQEPFQYNDVWTLQCIVYLDPGSQPIRIGQRVRVTIK